MKENEWRSKLVKAFTQNFKDQGFIWVNDVRYKAGWPDIYVVLNGFSSHYELKLCRGSILIDQMSPLQRAVCRRLAKAGAHVSCLTYLPETELVHVECISQQTEYVLSLAKFNERWIAGMKL